MKVVIVPDWVVMLPACVLPFWWIVGKGLRRKRRREGCCPACGYDLRATPDRCPECGRAVNADAMIEHR
jgi:predicted amidophosphoribosyltransferase